jgi:hypothetical protein
MKSVKPVREVIFELVDQYIDTVQKLGNGLEGS